MAETIKLKTTQLYKYRWVLITWGIFLLVCGILEIYLWPIISLNYGPRFITLCIAYYFFILGISFIMLCFFGLKDHQSHQEGEFL